MIKSQISLKDYVNIVKLKGNGLVYSNVFINSLIWEKATKDFEKIQAEALNVPVMVERKIPQRAKENLWVDKWGCKWHYPGNYLDGVVVEHPIDDWKKYKDFKFPDPHKYRDWDTIRQEAKQAKSENRVSQGGVEHGFLYLKLTYLRGFENFMFDIAEDREELYDLRDRLIDYWTAVVQHLIECGVNEISFGDDLGLQKNLPIKPEKWREFLKPAFAKIFKLCKESNVIVYLHTDGYIVDIISDLVEIGVDILNVQDFVNGLENLQQKAKGKVCIDLDIDRTKLTPFGKPQEIDEHIHKCISMLGSDQGGLTLKYAAYPPTPKVNILQVVASIEKYCTMWT